MDQILPVTLSSSSSAPAEAACLSADGEAVAVLTPAGEQLALSAARWGRRVPVGAVLPLSSRAAGSGLVGCLVDRSLDAVVWGPSSSKPGRQSVMRLAGQPNVRFYDARGLVGVAGCRQGAIVLSYPGRIVIDWPSDKSTTLEATAAGCTPGGSVWRLHGQEVSWISASS